MPSAAGFPAVYAVNPQGMSPRYISTADKEQGIEGKINYAKRMQRLQLVTVLLYSSHELDIL
jgi:hypothetical protein